MKKKLFFAANWKMYLSAKQEIEFAQAYQQELATLSSQASIALFPSFISLAAIAYLYKNSSIAIGAQNCAAYESGPYTGQVSAQSLAQVGCSLCIVGHSEQRTMGETDEQIAQKLTQLITQQITPILCVGETAQERTDNLTSKIIEGQLKHALQSLSASTEASSQVASSILIAYEPVWAIGTGNVPSAQEISDVCALIRKTVAELWAGKSAILYGGSVSSKTIGHFLLLPLDGFLISSASVDFQEFKKTVSSAHSY